MYQSIRYLTEKINTENNINFEFGLHLEKIDTKSTDKEV